MDLHVYVHLDSFTTLERKLDTITRQLVDISAKENDMAGELNAVKARVAENTTVIGSAITLIQGLKGKLDEAIASGDPAALQAIADELAAQDQALANAVAANTPAA